MTTNVIYIAAHQVFVMSGSSDAQDMLKIDRYKTYDLLEHAMINGVITDETALRKVLQQVHDDGIHKAGLVIDSGQINMKSILVPALNKKELRRIIQDQMPDSNGKDEVLYDYSVLHTSFQDKPGGEILCCGIEKKLLKSYIDVFANAGIQLSFVDVSVNAFIKLMKELSEFDGKTCIASVVDDTYVTSYLFENCEYVFSNRARLFAPRNSESFIQEMNEHISSLLQFHKSNHSSFVIKNVYFCGLEASEEQALSTQMKTYLQIEGSRFPNSKSMYIDDRTLAQEFELHRYIYPVGAMIRK